MTFKSTFNDTLYAAPLDRDSKLRSLYVNDHRANMGSVRVEAQGGWTLTKTSPIRSTARASASNII